MRVEINETNPTSSELIIVAPSVFPSNEAEAVQYIQNFITQYDLPAEAEISFDELSKKITVIWRSGEAMNAFRQKYPEAFHKNDWLGCPVEKAKFEFSPDHTISLETVYFGRTGWGKAYQDPNFIVQQGIVSYEENQLAVHITTDFETADWPANHDLYDW